MKAMWTVLGKELRDLARDRRTVLIALLMGPVFIPVLMIGLLTIAQKKSSTQMEETLELPVVGAEYAPNLVAWLEGHNVDVVEPPADVAAAVRAQDVDVVLEIGEDFGEQWRGSEPATVELVRDASRQDSRIPFERVEGLLQAYGQQVGALRLVARGIAPSVASPLLVAQRDLSTPESRAGQFMGFLPYFLILIAFVGGALEKRPDAEQHALRHQRAGQGALDRAARAVALLTSAVSFVLSVWLLAAFDKNAEFQFTEKFEWLEGLGASYHMGYPLLSIIYNHCQLISKDPVSAPNHEITDITLQPLPVPAL